jgi:nucleoid DNA-binding protein
MDTAKIPLSKGDDMTNKQLLEAVSKAQKQVETKETELEKAIDNRKKAILDAAKDNTQMELAVASGLSIQTIQRDLRDARKAKQN